jgi:cytochrome c biogenesis protein
MLTATDRRRRLGTQPGSSSSARRHLRDIPFAGRMWHLLASMKLALTLILGIAVLTLAGTLLDQVPEGVLEDRFAYDKWLAQAQGRYGMWAGPFERLGLFNVFHSLAFRALMGALAVSIVVCTMSRWRGIWNTAFHTPVRVPEAFFGHARYQAQLETSLPVADAAARVRKALRSSRYRVSEDVDATTVALFGDRNRWSRFGTFLSHLALVLILIGAIASGIWGFKDPEFIVAEGSTRDLGLGTNISVRLDHFADEYYINGPPKDYRSDVVLLDNGREVKQGTIRVNSPMRYHGIAFHQSFYGQAAVMKVEDATGKLLFEDNVPLSAQTGDGLRPVGDFDVPTYNLTAFVIGPASGAEDSAIPAGEVRVELFSGGSSVGSPANLTQSAPAKIAGLTFTFERESRFSGLKVVKDPGVNIIWVACALMMAGMVSLFYLPPRRLWALCVRRPDGTTEVRMAMPAQRDFAMNSEFERMSDKVKNALGDAPSDPREGGNHV